MYSYLIVMLVFLIPVGGRTKKFDMLRDLPKAYAAELEPNHTISLARQFKEYAADDRFEQQLCDAFCRRAMIEHPQCRTQALERLQALQRHLAPSS